VLHYIGLTSLCKWQVPAWLQQLQYRLLLETDLLVAYREHFTSMYNLVYDMANGCILKRRRTTIQAVVWIKYYFYLYYDRHYLKWFQSYILHTTAHTLFFKVHDINWWMSDKGDDAKPSLLSLLTFVVYDGNANCLYLDSNRKLRKLLANSALPSISPTSERSSISTKSKSTTDMTRRRGSSWHWRALTRHHRAYSVRLNSTCASRSRPTLTQSIVASQ